VSKIASSRPPVEPEDPDDIRHILSQPWFFKFVEYLFEYISKLGSPPSLYTEGGVGLRRRMRGGFETGFCFYYFLTTQQRNIFLTYFGYFGCGMCT
jgi:hypothetical protein